MVAGAAAALIFAGAGCVRDHSEVPAGAAGFGGGASMASGKGGGGVGGHGPTGGQGGGGSPGGGAGGAAATGGAGGGGKAGGGGAAGRGGAAGGAGGNATGGGAGGSTSGGGAGGNVGGAGGSVNRGPAVLKLEPLSPATNDFGTVSIGASATSSFVVTNTGGMPTGALRVAAIAAPFTIAPAAAGDCVAGQTSLAAGDACSLRVTFAPTASGPASLALSVTGTAAGSAMLTITGRAPGFRALAAGDYHTCAVLDGGSVSCWGSNAAGQLGRDGSVAFDPAPAVVPLASQATAVAAGSWHTCALLASGQVVCWGRNDYGQLGDGSMTDSLRPVTAANVSGARAIAAGSHLTCALLATGGVMCWGASDAVGTGDPADPSNYASPTPKAVSGLADAIGIAAGGDHACARRQGGAVACWGVNTSGQVGNGGVDTTQPVIVPAPVVDLKMVAMVAAGGAHTCARLDDGSASCWGDNFEGEVGVGAVSMMEPRPLAVPGLAGVTDLAGGGHHTCAIYGGGHVSCWGDNMYAQTGQRMSAYGHVVSPLDVPGIADGLTVAAGLYHTCVTRASGRVSCWGDGSLGQTGRPTNGSNEVPVDVQLKP